MTARLHVHLILSPDNASWIIEKMAERLAAHSAAHGVEVTVGPKPDTAADLNHWMSYAFANVKHTTPVTMLITHLDDPYKVGLVRKELDSGVGLAICLSSHTKTFLAEQGIDPDALAFVVPGHDFVAKPRRIVLGLTTRIYGDGRKREFMLVELAKRMRLDAFRFEIFGKGWDAIIPQLEAAGAEVGYFPGTHDYVADYAEIRDHLPHFDYYLYLGRDEGSLGTLDALAAGVKTIVTPQGFHVDLPGGITHPIWETDDLEMVLRGVAGDVATRTGAVADCSWENYARHHCALWRAVIAPDRAVLTALLAEQASVSPPLTPARSEDPWRYRLRSFSPWRIRSALSHIPALKPVRRWVKGR